MKTFEDRIAAVEAELAVVKATVAAISANKVAPPLPDVDIHGPHGDPEIRKDPPRWDGDSCVGLRYSECPCDYLDSLAGFLEWKAAKNDADPAKEKYARYDRLDAARAKKWSALKRDEAKRYGTTGHGASAKHTAPRDDDEIPF